MDLGHKKADEQLKKLEKRIMQEYNSAHTKVKKKARQYFDGFRERDKAMWEKYKANEITHEDYIKWRNNAMVINNKWKTMEQDLAREYSNARKIADAMIEDHSYGVYAENYNYGIYEIEDGLSISTSLTLYDRDTVRRLVVENPELLPPPGKRTAELLASGKLQKWNTQKIESVLLQGILSGESIPEIAKGLRKVTDMNIVSALRNARTMTTRAENAGRIRAYEKAQNIGVELMKKWVSTLDHRTRDSHVDVDGEVVKLNETFSNELDYPGGMGPPEEVYNCRCTMVAELVGFDHKDERISEMLNENYTYDEWKSKARKRIEKKEERKNGKRNK